jgi:hypothetical protein
MAIDRPTADVLAKEIKDNAPKVVVDYSREEIYTGDASTRRDLAGHILLKDAQKLAGCEASDKTYRENFQTELVKLGFHRENVETQDAGIDLAKFGFPGGLAIEFSSDCTGTKDETMKGADGKTLLVTYPGVPHKGETQIKVQQDPNPWEVFLHGEAWARAERTATVSGGVNDVIAYPLMDRRDVHH